MTYPPSNNQCITTPTYVPAVGDRAHDDVCERLSLPPHSQSQQLKEQSPQTTRSLWL